MIPIVGLDLSRETILLSSSGIRFRHFFWSTENCVKQ